MQFKPIIEEIVMTNPKKRKTTLEYAKEVIDKTDGEYRIESSYINAFTDVRFKHLTCGTYFDMKPNAFNNGQRCTNKECKRKRMADKQHRRSYNRLLKAVEKRKDHYKLLTKFSRYGGNESQIRLYCKMCDRYFSMSAHSFMNGRGCYKCGLLRRRLKRMKSPNQFYREVHDVLGDSYTFDSKYQGIGELIKIRHSCGYSWWAHPASLLAGQQCKKCFPKRGILRDELIILLNKYQCKPVNTLRKEMYYSYDRVYIQHQCGYKFWQKVDRIKNPRSKYGICKKCNRKKLSKDRQLSETEFLGRFNKLPFSNEYLIIGSYRGMFIPIQIYHKLCRHYDDVTPQSLLRGRECKWCRNHRKSVGERLICSWLDYMNVNYEYPKKFDDLSDKGLLHYDFYLPDYNVLIEVQGIQHYGVVKYFGGEEQFKIQQKHDQMKRQYAKEHGYRLIEIPTNKESIKDTIHNIAKGLISIFGRNSMEQSISQGTDNAQDAEKVAKIVRSAIQHAIENYNRGDNG